MCIGICAIAVQRGTQRLFYKSGVNSHGNIRKVFRLKDDKPQEQVNLEAHLKGDFFNPKDWTLVVDHDMSNLPKWFIDDRPEVEGLFWTFLEDEIKETKASGVYKGALNLSGLTSAKGLVLPTKVGGGLSLSGLTSAEGLVLPTKVGGSLFLSGLTSAEGLVLPTKVGGDLSLSGLTSAEGLVLPTKVGGYLNLSGLTSAEGLVLPTKVGGSLFLSGLTSAKGLVLPTKVGGGLSLSGLSSEDRNKIREKG
jgi:hypothetical protein